MKIASQTNQSEEPGHIFIIGRERSGTTLLRSILHAHSYISIPPESTFIWDLFPIYGNCQHWTENTYRQFIKDLNLDVRFRLWGLDNSLLLKELTALGNRTTYQAVCQRVLACYNLQDKNERPLWVGDKNPAYTFFQKELHFLFPQARFIYIVRDYRDVLTSLWPLDFETRWTAAMCYRWTLGYHKFLVMKELYPDQFYLLRYEDLVAQPESELKKLLHFLKLPWDDTLMNYHRKTKKLLGQLPGRLTPYLANLDQPVNPSRIGQWKTFLSKKQVKIAEAICSDLGSSLGYEPSLPLHQKRDSYRLARLWSQLYFKIERLSQKLPGSLKRLYLYTKHLSQHGWHQKVKKSQTKD